MENNHEFPVRRRADSSIDTEFYSLRAKRFHTANFALVARWIISRLKSEPGNQLVIRRRPA